MEEGRAGVEPGLGDAAGAEEVGGRQTRSGGRQAKAGKALEDDTGEIVPVADEISEDADKQRFLHQSRDDVVITAPRPEQRCQRDVDRDQRGGDEGHLGLKQLESAVDILGKDCEKSIYDAGAAHGSLAFRRRDRRPSLRQATFVFSRPGRGETNVRGAVVRACRWSWRLALSEELPALLRPDTPARLKRVRLLWRQPPASCELGGQRICLLRPRR